MCVCGVGVKTTGHFLLRCHFYSTQKSELFDKLDKFAKSKRKRSNSYFGIFSKSRQF